MSRSAKAITEACRSASSDHLERGFQANAIKGTLRCAREELNLPWGSHRRIRCSQRQVVVLRNQLRHLGEGLSARPFTLMVMASDTWVRQKQQGPAMGVDPREVSPTHLADAVATSGWDVFISHASEDKDDIARPLAEALQARGVSVWFDELNIAWGQPIHRAIEAGIANGTYGLVIISPTFMVKQWTQAELDALHGRQMGRPDGHGLILPLWHRVTTDDVQQNLPMIAALKALNTAVLSVEQIADEAAKLVFASR